MKKRLFSIALCLMLLLSLCVTAHAADGVYLIDEPGLLTRDEAETLESRAAELTGRYGIGVYIAVVDDFTDYASDCETASEEIYLANGFGVGSEQNGILLMLSMADRDYDLCAYGTDAHLAFTDYGKERLAEDSACAAVHSAARNSSTISGMTTGIPALRTTSAPAAGC